MSRGPWDHRGKMKFIYLREARKVSQRKGCLAWVYEVNLFEGGLKGVSEKVMLGLGFEA